MSPALIASGTALHPLDPLQEDPSWNSSVTNQGPGRRHGGKFPLLRK